MTSGHHSDQHQHHSEQQQQLQQQQLTTVANSETTSTENPRERQEDNCTRGQSTRNPPNSRQPIFITYNLYFLPSSLPSWINQNQSAVRNNQQEAENCAEQNQTHENSQEQRSEEASAAVVVGETTETNITPRNSPEEMGLRQSRVRPAPMQQQPSPQQTTRSFGHQHHHHSNSGQPQQTPQTQESRDENSVNDATRDSDQSTQRQQQQQQQHFVHIFLPGAGHFFIPAPPGVVPSEETGYGNNNINSGISMENWLESLFSPAAFQAFFEMHEQHERQKRTVAGSVLEKLPVIRLSSERQQIMQRCNKGNDSSDCSSGDEDLCALCQEQFEIDQELVMLPCQHTFHSNCGIREWLTEHNHVCPLCRFELPMQDPELEKERMKRMEQRFGKSGMKVIDLNVELENMLERLATTMRVFRQRKNVDNLKAEDVHKMIAEVGDIDASLMYIMVQLDGIDVSEFKEDNMRQQRKGCILKIQSMQHVIDEQRVAMQAYLDRMHNVSTSSVCR